MSNKVDFNPMHGAILILLPKIEEKTKSGIIKSDGMVAEEKKEGGQNFFDVLCISHGEELIKVGDKVMCNLSGGNLVDIDGTQHALIPKHAILGYI